MLKKKNPTFLESVNLKSVIKSTLKTVLRSMSVKVKSQSACRQITNTILVKTRERKHISGKSTVRKTQPPHIGTMQRGMRAYGYKQILKIKGHHKQLLKVRT